MKKIFSLLFALLFMAGTTGVFTSCQEDAPEINYTISVTVNNDFTEVVNAINNGTLKQEAAVAALTAAIEKMQGDQDSKQQAIADAINDLAKTTDAKLAIIEAAMKAQILSQEEASAKILALLEGIDTAVNPDYVTFTADDIQTLKYEGSDLQYSIDGGITFNHLPANTEITFGGPTILYLRGVNNLDGNFYDSKDYIQTQGYKISFGKDDVPVACTGDIRTLIDYKTYKTVDTSNAKFISLFKDCTELTSAPALPATTLADNCYYAMFYNCKSLVNAPALPATTLAERCYSNMFSNCTSLEDAPELPATTLAFGCYESMFQNCSSLVTAPELPATTLANQCYADMFSGCEKLTDAPALPATTLAHVCYSGMFSGCKKLTDAPALPATTLETWCYAFMFQNCTSLVNAPELPVTTLAVSCYQRMFDGCTSLVNAPALPATTLANKCYGAMFSNCTSLEDAPALPATTLAEYCYGSMFYGCEKLTEAPELPATTLTDNCYNQMFYECTSLNKITMLATDISATDCLKDWVQGVAATGTFTMNASATYDPSTIGIPTGWTVVNQ